MTLLNAPVHTLQDFLLASRRVAGLSTRQLGAGVGVSAATVSKWERGFSEPSVTQFVAWCRETQQPLDRVIEGLAVWVSCTPRDLNPEPTDYGSDAAAFWAIVADVALAALTE